MLARLREREGGEEGRKKGDIISIAIL